MDITQKNPTMALWHDMAIVKISDIGKGFSEWLGGQTMPLVDDDENPLDWAYYEDYVRFINHLPIID